MADLGEALDDYRGRSARYRPFRVAWLVARKDLTVEVRSREQVRQYLNRKMARQLPPAEIAAIERTYRAFGLPVSGGVAALGLIHGREHPPEGDRLWTYEVCRDFVSRFQTAFGATVCREKSGNAKSILGILALGVNQNDEIVIHADGTDESQALAALNHPGIAAIHGVEESGVGV